MERAAQSYLNPARDKGLGCSVTGSEGPQAPVEVVSISGILGVSCRIQSLRRKYRWKSLILCLLVVLCIIAHRANSPTLITGSSVALDQLCANLYRKQDHQNYPS